MTYIKRAHKNKAAHLLLVLAMAGQIAPAALADGDGQLQPGLAVEDNTPAGAAFDRNLPPANRTTKLTGSVDMLDSAAGAQGKGGLQGQAQETDAAGATALKSGTAARDENDPAFRLAIQKLAAREALNSDDYRSLGIGILGYESNHQFFSSTAEIITLFPGCPAADAGIRVGDLELYRDDSEAQSDTHGLTKFICGLAGKQVNVIIKRGRKELHFNLVRMNVEDIPDDRLRRTYERMIRRMASKLVRAYPQLDPKTVGQ